MALNSHIMIISQTIRQLSINTGLALGSHIPEIIFQKVDFEKKSADDKNACKITHEAKS